MFLSVIASASLRINSVAVVKQATAQPAAATKTTKPATTGQKATKATTATKTTKPAATKTAKPAKK